MILESGLLTCHPWVTVKLVNKALKPSGYILKFAGYNGETNFLVYRFDRLPNTKHPLADPHTSVYALGDYTPDEWVKILNDKLKHTSKAAYQRAKEKRYRAKKKER